MKIISFLCVFFLLFILPVSTYAANANLGWENTLDVYVEYDNEANMIDVLATIPSEINEKDSFSFGIYIDGREYRKFFEYNKDAKIMYVSFEIPQDLTDTTTIFISIKDVQYNEIYSTIPENYSINNISNSNNTSVTSYFGPSTWQKDYGVFSMQASTSQKQNTSNYTYSYNAIENTRQNISDLTREDLLSVIDSGDYLEEEIPEIIESLQKYNVIPDTTNSTSTTTVEKYVPKYSAQSAEPSVINGIGNSSTSSWRNK